MVAYSLLHFDPELSVLGMVRLKRCRFRANLGHSLKEAVYNLLLWAQDNEGCSINDFMNEIDYPFVHSTVEANAQS
jgi:hypothetical protein